MKRFLFILVIIFSEVSAFSQEDKIDSLLNNLIYNDSELLALLDTPIKYDFLYGRASFSNKTFYAGREVSSDMFNISSNIFYYNSTGLYAGVSGNWFDQLTPAYSSTTFTVGFSKAIDRKKMFTFRSSYSYFLQYKPDTSALYPYKNNASVGLTFRKKWIGARVSGNYLFGDQSKITLTSSLNTYFTLLRLGNYNKIYIKPEVSVFFGPETITTSTGLHETIYYNEEYGLLNTTIYVPLSIDIWNFDVEMGYGMNFPVTRDTNASYKNDSFLTISIGYILSIPKAPKIN